MGSFEVYRLRRFLPAVFICSYALVALNAIPAGSREFYPFFNWSLFSRSADFRTDVVLQVRSIEGRTLDEPRLLYDMKESLSAAKNRNGVLMKTIDRLYMAVYSGDQVTAERLQNVIETRFLSDVSAIEYDLVVIGYNPIDRLTNMTIREKKVISSYEKSLP
ncbi:MAG: hypothetical protein WD489_03670 [Rhodovibrionaceae bacterium]